jgi:hypothetical protein
MDAEDDNRFEGLEDCGGSSDSVLKIPTSSFFRETLSEMQQRVIKKHKADGHIHSDSNLHLHCSLCSNPLFLTSNFARHCNKKCAFNSNEGAQATTSQVIEGHITGNLHQRGLEYLGFVSFNVITCFIFQIH